MVQSVMRFVSMVISFYMLVLLVRIIMTWFQTPGQGRGFDILYRVTDPYLNFFRRFGFMQLANVDFSPVVALISLSILSDIASSLAFAGRITLGFVLARVISSLWSAASFFFMIFLILAIVRLVVMLLNIESTGTFWITIDRLLQPLCYGLVDRMMTRTTTYRNALMLFGGVTALALLAGNLLVAQLVTLLVRVPV